MAWKDLTSLQKLNSGGLDAYVWNGQTAATQKQLLETINKRIKLRKETGSITTVKENPEQRAARKIKKLKHKHSVNPKHLHNEQIVLLTILRKI